VPEALACRIHSAARVSRRRSTAGPVTSRWSSRGDSDVRGAGNRFRAVEPAGGPVPDRRHRRQYAVRPRRERVASHRGTERS
jgi:hypothetical protein